jgi:uncharacterized protein (TIGR00269 family)
MKCRRCGSKSAVYLKYSDQHLCENCFTRLFERRVRRTIRANRLLPQGGTVGVAVSGGKDSMTVLKILVHLTAKNPELKVVALIVDEGIRGKKKAFKTAINYCSDLGVDYTMYSFKEEYGFTLDGLMRRVRGDGVLACTYCGVLRRRVLNNKAFELGVSRIATGHNLDDEVQSSLMNFIRGDFDRIVRMGPLTGVVGEERFVPRIKPLREVLELEVGLYARFNKIPVASFDCPHARGALRRSTRSLLNEFEGKHPGSKHQLLKSTDKLIEMLRPRYSGGRMNYCVLCGEPASGRRCRVCELLERIGK